jgi:uncharacterized protein with HEPN domain
MKRSTTERIADIRKAISRAQKSFALTDSDDMDVMAAAYDSMERQVEIIGEAAKHLPRELTDKYPQVDWRSIRGTREFMAHEYWGIDYGLLLDIVENKLGEVDTILAIIQQNSESIN